MRPPFSTLADRLPSLALLLLRVVTAAVLVFRCVQLHRFTPLHTATPFLIAAGAGLLLLFGSWTVLAGSVVVIVELFLAFSHAGDLSVSVLLATLGLALALLGPGGWSVDAQRFGWKRIEIRRPE
jgi:Zn-dependent protease